jgi:hypothetical protein
LKTTEFPTEISPEIKALLQKKDEVIAQQAEGIAQLTTRLNWFEEQFKLLTSNHYATSTETSNALQLTLFDEDEENLEVETEAEAGSTEDYSATKNLDRNQ